MRWRQGLCQDACSSRSSSPPCLLFFVLTPAGFDRRFQSFPQHVKVLYGRVLASAADCVTNLLAAARGEAPGYGYGAVDGTCASACAWAYTRPPTPVFCALGCGTLLGFARVAAPTQVQALAPAPAPALAPILFSSLSGAMCFKRSQLGGYVCSAGLAHWEPQLVVPALVGVRARLSSEVFRKCHCVCYVFCVVVLCPRTHPRHKQVAHPGLASLAVGCRSIGCSMRYCLPFSWSVLLLRILCCPCGVPVASLCPTPPLCRMLFFPQVPRNPQCPCLSCARLLEG